MNWFMGSATTVIGGVPRVPLDWAWPPGATPSEQFAVAGGAAGARLIRGGGAGEVSACGLR